MAEIEGVAHPPRPCLCYSRVSRTTRSVSRSRVKRITPDSFLAWTRSIFLSRSLSSSPQRREFLAIRRSLLKGVKATGPLWFFYFLARFFRRSLSGIAWTRRDCERRWEIFVSYNLTWWLICCRWCNSKIFHPITMNCVWVKWKNKISFLHQEVNILTC